MLSIHKFITQIDADRLSETDKEIIIRIRNNTAAKSDFMGVYSQLSSLPYLKIRYSNLGRRLGWISLEQNRSDINTYFNKYTYDGSVNRDDATSIDKVGPMNVTYADQPVLVSGGSEAIRLIGRTRTNDPGFTSPLEQMAANPSSTYEQKSDAARSLAQIRPSDASNILAYKRLLSSTNQDTVKAALSYAYMLPANDQIIDTVSDLASSADTRIKYYACSSLRNMMRAGQLSESDYKKACSK
jgi:hypothetical protein